MSKYLLIDSGSALGRGCGPLVIKKPETILNSKSKIAIPGKNTTANALLNLAFPNYNNKVELLFSEIENQILLETVDAGVIIHENRFTYHKKGLEKVKDLGEFWEEESGFPLPLGGIVVNRKLSFEVQKSIERVLRKSVEYAFKNRESSFAFIKHHSQEMAKHVIDSHINLYVNNYTLSLGREGKEAIKLFFEKAGQKTDDLFV